GQRIDDAGGDEEEPGLLFALVCQHDANVLVASLSPGDADAAELDAVPRELAAAELVELTRRDAVTTEVAVQRRRQPVARLPEVAHENAPAASPEHQGGAEAGWSAADDYHVVHARSSCKTVSTL